MPPLNRHSDRLQLAAAVVAAVCGLSALVQWTTYCGRAHSPGKQLYMATGGGARAEAPLALAEDASSRSDYALHELSLDLVYDAASTEVSPGLFPHSVIDAACPRFVHIEYHDHAGVGHRLSNLAMAMIGAQVLNATLAYDPLDYSSIRHGNYSGADAFFGLAAGEITRAEAYARFTNLSLVRLPRMDGYRKWEAGGPFSPVSSLYSEWAAAAASKRVQCFVAYELPRDDWVRDPKPFVKWIFARKWAANEAALQLAGEAMQAQGAGGAPSRERLDLVPLGMRSPLSEAEKIYQLSLRIPLWPEPQVQPHQRWQRHSSGDEGGHADAGGGPPSDALVVAVHLRVGDINPTPPVWIAAVLSGAVLRSIFVLAPALPVHIHVFMQEDIGAQKMWPITELQRESNGRRGGVVVSLHIGGHPLATFWHLTRPDVLVQSRSAFSEYAALVATRPLAFAAAGSRFANNSYWQCGVDNICCDPVSGACPYEAHIRIARLLHRRGWSAPVP